MIINDTYLFALIGIMVNGIVTGFAVYIGSHYGQRMIDKLKTEKEVIKTVENNIKERFEKDMAGLKDLVKKDGQ